MGLLPFDLETALREPERVRRSTGEKAVRVVHLPELDPPQVLVIWDGWTHRACFFDEKGYDSSEGDWMLRLAPKTRKVWVRIMGCRDGEFDTHISLHPACQEALPVGWRWLDSGPTEIEIREDA